VPNESSQCFEIIVDFLFLFDYFPTLKITFSTSQFATEQSFETKPKQKVTDYCLDEKNL
jgi:hypothetical protein